MQRESPAENLLAFHAVAIVSGMDSNWGGETGVLMCPLSSVALDGPGGVIYNT